MWRVLRRKNCRDLIMILIDLAILDEIAFMWGCHDRFWFSAGGLATDCLDELIRMMSLIPCSSINQQGFFT